MLNYYKCKETVVGIA